MIVKKGVLKATSASGNESSYNVVSVSGSGWSETFLTNAASDDGRVSSIHNGIDITDENALGDVFNNTSGPYTFEWETPMAQVDSTNGGVSILDVYPRGTVYTTADTSFDPSTAWGGTWTGTAVSGKKQWIRTA